MTMNSWDLVHPESRELVIEQAFKRFGGDQSGSRYEVKILTGKSVSLRESRGRTDHRVLSRRTYRHFLDVFDTETKRSGRTERSFALLLLDLDGLKQINDTHGHLVGSRVLCRLAHSLRLQCRTIDTAARHGGDEFAIILPETDAEGARSLGRRVAERDFIYFLLEIADHSRASKL